MHSKNLDNLDRMANEINTSIFVKNGRSQAGLGLDGEGTCSFTIASPTGEGLTGPRQFSRWRRCVRAGSGVPVRLTSMWAGGRRTDGWPAP